MPDDRDAIELLGTVERLDVEHEIDHFLLFTTKRAAKRASVALTARDFVIADLVRLFGRWCMTVHTRMLPEEHAIVGLREIFTEIAEEHDGDYDGWEADLRTEEQKAEDRRNGGS